MKYNNYKTTKRSKYNLLYQTVFKGVTKSLGNYGIYIILESKGYRKEKREMKKLAVMVLMASISLTACSNGNEKVDNMEVMENIEETSTIEKTKETDESNGVNSVGEDTILGEGDYKETDIEADMILSEDLQKIYDSFSEEDKALYRELMKDVDTSDTTPPSTGTTPPSTGTEEVIYSDPDYVHGQGDYSELSTTAVGY